VTRLRRLHRKLPAEWVVDVVNRDGRGDRRDALSGARLEIGANTGLSAEEAEALAEAIRREIAALRRDEAASTCPALAPAHDSAARTGGESEDMPAPSAGDHGRE
jgi:hypothetical protein